MTAAKWKGKDFLRDSFNYNATAENVEYLGYFDLIDFQPNSASAALSFECEIYYDEFITATLNASSSREPVHGRFLSCRHR
jgi:hypothetical protein